MIRLKCLAQFQKGRIPQELFKEPSSTRAPYLSMEYLRGQTISPDYAEIDGAVLANGGDTILLWDAGTPN